MSDLLFIGIGNEYRHDDAVGLMVARDLKGQGISHARIEEHSGEGASLMDLWAGTSDVIVCDAVSSGAMPGTVHRLEAHREALPSDFFHYSTHAFSLAEAVELARSLGKLPERLVVYGIEGKDFASGRGLSAEVEAAAQAVVQSILKEDSHA